MVAYLVTDINPATCCDGNWLDSQRDKRMSDEWCGSGWIFLRKWFTTEPSRISQHLQAALSADTEAVTSGWS